MLFTDLMLIKHNSFPIFHNRFSIWKVVLVKRNQQTSKNKTRASTFMTVTFEVIDGADIIILAGLWLACNTSAGAFTGLRTVLGHKCLLQLQVGQKRWKERWNEVKSHNSTHTVPQGILQRSICWSRCSHTVRMAHRFLHSWRNLCCTGTPPYRNWCHTRRVLPGWHKRRGKMTYKANRCCWHCRRGLGRRDYIKITISN